MLRSFWSRIRRAEFEVLLATVILAGGLWGFGEFWEVASAATPHAFDAKLLLLFRDPADLTHPIGPFWMEESMRDITALGSATVLVLILLLVVLYLLLAGRWAAALFAFLAVAGGQYLSSLLKLGIDRPRPDLVPHLTQVYTMSFPSGHAMLSAVTYLTLGSLLARVSPGRVLKGYALFVAVAITLLVGISRIYLGVHWPSDVLAGWCAGAAWAMLCWLVARFVLSQAGRRFGKPEDAARQ